MNIDLRRRSLLAAMAGAAATLVATPRLWAKDAPGWPAKEFDELEVKSVYALLDANSARVSSRVQVIAPRLAQNGATVPFTVKTSLKNVDLISVVVPSNPFPLAAKYHFPEGTEPYVVNRLKMKKTDDIVALVHTRDGKIYRASTHVKVTVGGCGG